MKSSPRSATVARSPSAVSAMPEATASAISRCAQLRAVDGVWAGAGGEEELVEQHAGARAGFAAGDEAPGQIGRPGEVMRVPGRDDQALLAAPQVQQVRVLPAEQGAGVGAL